MPDKLRVMSKRDLEITLALLHKVRLFSLRQLSDHWFHADVANARRRLALLANSGLLHKVRLSARSLPPLMMPVAIWAPGQAPPSFGATSYQLKNRWKNRPTRTITTFVASGKASRLLGGRPSVGLKSGTQATHDLAVSAVWLHLCSHCPMQAEMWRGEDAMANTRRGQKLPDAFLVNDSKVVEAVIEFGGSYSTERVAEFHADCLARSLPYQIW